jgi:hypothetical protein
MSPPEAGVPVISVDPGSSLCVEGLVLEGGVAGILLGSPAAGHPAEIVEAYDVVVNDAERGIYGSAREMRLESSRVSNATFGVVVAGTVELVDVVLANNYLGALLTGGLRPICVAAYEDVADHVVISGLAVSDSSIGGIAVCNAASAIIENVLVHRSAYVGIQIRTTPSFLVNEVTVRETRPWQGNWGDGLAVIESSGEIKSSEFSANARINVLWAGGGSGVFTGNSVHGGAYGVCLLPVGGTWPNPTLYDNAVDGPTCDDLLPLTPMPMVPEL